MLWLLWRLAKQLLNVWNVLKYHTKLLFLHKKCLNQNTLSSAKQVPRLLWIYELFNVNWSSVLRIYALKLHGLISPGVVLKTFSSSLWNFFVFFFWFLYMDFFSYSLTSSFWDSSFREFRDYHRWFFFIVPTEVPSESLSGISGKQFFKDSYLVFLKKIFDPSRSSF